MGNDLSKVTVTGSIAAANTPIFDFFAVTP